MGGINPLKKTKILQLSHLVEIVEYTMELERAIHSLTRDGHYGESLVLRGELSGINKVLDGLRLRTEAIMLAKLKEEGKVE